MKELIGKPCSCRFNCKIWPISGDPAYIVIEALDMPMVKIRSIFGGQHLWVNASAIEQLVEMEAAHEC